MPVTAAELENIANTTMDFHWGKEIESQTIQDKPLLSSFKKKMTEFPGGKDYIDIRVKGEYTTGIEGYEYDDEVNYDNPANVRTAFYPWKEIHGGISCTHTELKKNGISVVDTMDSANVRSHSDRDAIMLADLFKDKLEDMSEGIDRGMNEMFWLDGTQDAKLVPGVQSFILDDPTSATVVGGIDQAANTWWRNRADVAISVSGGAAAQPLAVFLQEEFRQLRRYGSPEHMGFAGNDFIKQMEDELRANGTFTQDGWASKGTVDMAIRGVKFAGVTFMYDPTLDDMDQADYCYILDMKSIFPKVMSGENMKRHTPARPENKYVLYRAVTWTGGLVCKRRNTSGVYKLA